jgi:hypothetical protein
MNYKKGDTVCIQSWKNIVTPRKEFITKDFITYLNEFAGKIAKIVYVEPGSYLPTYKLDIDGGEHSWADWMFDPYFRADEPLSAEDAIRAMLDGETLTDDEGAEHFWDADWDRRGAFVYRKINETSVSVAIFYTGLYRRPAKRKRLMTRFEVLNWANSEASHGWVVRPEGNDTWHVPQFFSYSLGECRFQRARLLPDLSGVDEDTIQGFEVEE